MSEAEQALPRDAPVMVVWERYSQSGRYENSRKWAQHEGHVDGSMWAAFHAGWEAHYVSLQVPVNKLETWRSRLLRWLRSPRS